MTRGLVTAEVTPAEARERALVQLVPPALASIRAHLGDGDPAAWRAGLRVLELAYGPAPSKPAEDVVLPDNAEDVRALGWRELQLVAARLAAELPTTESADETAATANPVTGNGVAPIAVTDDGKAE